MDCKIPTIHIFFAVATSLVSKVATFGVRGAQMLDFIQKNMLMPMDNTIDYFGPTCIARAIVLFQITQSGILHQDIVSQTPCV